MARELEDVLPHRRRATTRSARSWSPAPGGAFCAGHGPLGRGQRLRPRRDPATPRPRTCATTSTRRRTSDGVRDTGGKVTLAIHALPKPVIAAINGAGRRHRRHHDARHGPPAGLDQGAHRLRLRPARHRARGGARRGSCPGSSASSRRWSGSTPPTSSPPRPRWPAGWCARCTSPTTCCRRRRSWPGPSSSAAPPSRWAWPSSCSTATAPPTTRSRRTVPTRWRCSHLDRRRQGGRGRVPGEARPGVHRPGLRAPGDLLAPLRAVLLPLHGRHHRRRPHAVERTTMQIGYTLMTEQSGPGTWCATPRAPSRPASTSR